MALDVDALTCAGTAAAVARGESDALDVVGAVIDAIDTRDGRVGAFLEVYGDDAERRARRIDADPTMRALPLAGVPIALKDNLCVAGKHVTAGSRILEPFASPFTATAVQRLEDAGAIVIGKTNLDEFAMGSSTENSGFQPTTNPWDPARVPGGSSGGSAAAVAAGMVPAALGSDTGGSVRQPAALCGTVGLKPTYGRISRSGLIAFASSLDQIGPLTRTVEDAALLLSIMAGHDSSDSTTLTDDVPDFHRRLEIDPAKLTIGVPSAWLGDGVADDVRTAVRSTLEALEASGAHLRPIELPHEKYAVPTYYVIAAAEASANLARYDGVRYGFRAADPSNLSALYRRTRSEALGAEVKRRILLGTFVLSSGYYDAYYGRAQCVRTLLCNDFAAAFADVDVVAGPTSPTTAFSIGEKTDDPVSMYLNDIFTVTANLAGLPAISVPCGTDDDGLPIGVQFVGPALGEKKILQAARLVEKIRGPWRPAPTDR